MLEDSARWATIGALALVCLAGWLGGCSDDDESTNLGPKADAGQDAVSEGGSDAPPPDAAGDTSPDALDGTEGHDQGLAVAEADDLASQALAALENDVAMVADGNGAFQPFDLDQKADDVGDPAEIDLAGVAVDFVQDVVDEIIHWRETRESKTRFLSLTILSPTEVEGVLNPY